MCRRLVFIGLAALWLPIAAAGAVRAQDLTDLPAETSAATAGTAEAETSLRQILDYQPELIDAPATAAELAQILAREEFQDDAGPESASESLWTRFMNWLTQRLNGAGLAPGTAAWPGVITVVAALLLIVYGLVRLLWALQARRRRSQGAAGGNGDPGLMTSTGLLRLAETAIQQGDYRTALRYRYLALLKLLEMPEAPRRTNHQVRHWINRRYPAAAAAFNQLVLAFEDAWYGGFPCGPAEYALADGYAGTVNDQILSDREAAAAEEARDARP